MVEYGGNTAFDSSLFSVCCCCAHPGPTSLLQDKIKSGKYNTHKKRVKVFLRVSIEGIATIDIGTGGFITKNAVHRIVGWSAPSAYYYFPTFWRQMDHNISSSVPASCADV
jgi:hypothetical protein